MLSVSENNLNTIYKFGSYLMDPMCTTHRLVKETNVKNTDKTTQYFKIAGNGCLALISTPVGVLYRSLVFPVIDKPFIHLYGTATEKALGTPFYIFSWNVCCVPAGYSITDGGVLPWPERINGIIDKIRSINADIVCLYEVFDIQTANILFDSLKNDYHEFYFNIGPKIIGLASGMFVASKYKTTTPNFTYFPRNALDKRAKFCNKGVFSFEIPNGIKIYSTHMQHSEIPIKPTQNEIAARTKEMEIILECMKKDDNKIIVLTGDFNLDDNEYNNSNWKDNFDKGDILNDSPTWGGDQFNSSFYCKQSSPPMNLDYTCLRKGSGASLETTLIDMNYNCNIFNTDALSDHQGLLTQVTGTPAPLEALR